MHKGDTCMHMHAYAQRDVNVLRMHKESPACTCMHLHKGVTCAHCICSDVRIHMYTTPSRTSVQVGPTYNQPEPGMHLGGSLGCMLGMPAFTLCFSSGLAATAASGNFAGVNGYAGTSPPPSLACPLPHPAPRTLPGLFL